MNECRNSFIYKKKYISADDKINIRILKKEEEEEKYIKVKLSVKFNVTTSLPILYMRRTESNQYVIRISYI